MKSYKEKRTVHIKGNVWTYIIDRKRFRNGEIRIYDLQGKIHRVPDTYFTTIGITDVAYQPYEIKKYIIKNLI